MYKIYVLENLKMNWYIGHTDNLSLRLYKHNTNQVRSTKNKGHWHIIYTEDFETRAEAMRKEKYLKSGRGRQFLKSTLKNNR